MSALNENEDDRYDHHFIQTKINVMVIVCSYSHCVHKTIFTTYDYNNVMHNYANTIMVLTSVKQA